MGLVLMVHSLVRWLVVLVAVLALAKFVIGWIGRAAPERTDRTLMSGFAGLIDLQALLGIILLVGYALTEGTLQVYRLEHAFVMIVAAALAHLPMRWRASNSPTVLRNNALVIVGVLVLVFLGVVVLPQGWLG